jgi:hypothetical protein
MFVVALLFLLHVLPETQSGTIIATYLSDERLIAAADSRITDNVGRAINDSRCKINVLGANSVFIAGGRAHVVNAHIDAMEIAAESRRNNRLATTEMLARLWGSKMKSALAAFGDIDRQGLIGGLKTKQVAMAIFARAEKGRIVAYVSEIDYRLDGKKIVLWNETFPLTKGVVVPLHGGAEVKEFFTGSSQRALDLQSKFTKEIEFTHAANPDPYRLIAAVQAVSNGLPMVLSGEM